MSRARILIPDLLFSSTQICRHLICLLRFCSYFSLRRTMRERIVPDVDRVISEFVIAVHFRFSSFLCVEPSINANRVESRCTRSIVAVDLPCISCMLICCRPCLLMRDCMRGTNLLKKQSLGKPATTGAKGHRYRQTATS